MNDAGRSVGPARGALQAGARAGARRARRDRPAVRRGAHATGGGLAGHNGLKSIKRELGSADFARVRVGVGRPDSTDPGDRLGLRARALPREPRAGRRARRAAPARRSSASCSASREPASRRRGALQRPGARLLWMAAHAARSRSPTSKKTAALRARARGRSRVRLLVAAPVPDRRARRPDERARSRRSSWWSATIARRATSRPTCARGWRRGGCATTRRAAWPTSPIWRRRRTWSACAWPRSTRCSRAARTAARADARASIGRGGRRWSSSAPSALSEKVPDPALRPHSFTLRVGELLDLDECARELVAAGYERVDQVEERGQFALRGGLLDVFGATEERAVRVDMFDVEIESLRWFSTFTQRSLGEVRGGRDRTGGRARRRAPRAGRDRRPPPAPSPRRRRASERPGHRRAAAGRALRRAARSDRRRRRSWWSPPRRSSRRR